MNLGIPRTDQLYRLLTEAGVEGTLYAFGSRAKGTGQVGSDLDLLLDGKEPLPLSVLATLEVLLSESDLPYLVDLVEARRATQTFLDAIRPDCIKLTQLSVITVP